MSKSNPYIGTVKMLGVKYKAHSVSKCTNEDGNTFCRKCGHTDAIRFVSEHVQYGFSFNRYYEFNECDRCGYRFAIVMTRKEDIYNA